MTVHSQVMKRPQMAVNRAIKDDNLRQESTDKEITGKKSPVLRFLRGVFVFICSILVILLLLSLYCLVFLALRN